MRFLFQALYVVYFAETVYHWSAQFGFLDVFAGNVFGEGGPAIIVYFRARQLVKLQEQEWGCVPVAENSWT